MYTIPWYSVHFPLKWVQHYSNSNTIYHSWVRVVIPHYLMIYVDESQTTSFLSYPSVYTSLCMNSLMFHENNFYVISVNLIFYASGPRVRPILWQFDIDLWVYEAWFTVRIKILVKVNVYFILHYARLSQLLSGQAVMDVWTIKMGFYWQIRVIIINKVERSKLHFIEIYKVNSCYFIKK